MGNKNRKILGFTLIELLVAITIIGIISTFGILKFVGEQARGRDVARKTHLSQLASALENYYNDKGSYVVGDTCAFYSEIAPYMKTLKAPYDPLFESDANDTCPNSSSMHYSYQIEDDGKSYRLYAKLENCNDPQVISRTSCSSDQYNYTVTSANLQAIAAPTNTQTPSSGVTSTPTPTRTPTPTSAPGPCGRSTHKCVFVTSATYNGALGGLSGADQKCLDKANAPGARLCGSTDCPSSSFKAWLSDSTNSPSTRFSAAVRSTTNPVTFKLVDTTTVVANGWSDLTDGSAIANAINKTETNGSPPDSSPGLCFPKAVWTNTWPTGSSQGPSLSCSNWTSLTDDGSVWGNSASTQRWTTGCTGGTDTCGLSALLYCFEQ